MCGRDWVAAASASLPKGVENARHPLVGRADAKRPGMGFSEAHRLGAFLQMNDSYQPYGRSHLGIHRIGRRLNCK